MKAAQGLSGPGVRVLALLAVVLAAGGSGCRAKSSEADQGRILFPHALHAEQAECADCHPGAVKDTGSPAGRHIPRGHAGCQSCHEVSEGCEKCHRGATAGVAFRRKERGLRFSHKAHTERVTACTACHAATRQAAPPIPGHTTCNTAACHQKDERTLACGRCHQDLARYRRPPGQGLRHGPGFARSHGLPARQNIRACVGCHDQTYCADCHSQTQLALPNLRFPEDIDAGFIHRGDYLARHAIEARADPQSCRKCHGQRSCRACHAQNGLAEAPNADLPGGQTRNPHPVGWMTAASGDFHGRQARMDISRCASCHDRGAASSCVSCHRVGGLGGNPHPPGWTRRDKAGQCQKNPMCATCHAGGLGCD